MARREVLGAATAAASALALPSCATLAAYRGDPIEPSCTARYCRQFVPDERLGEGLGRCRLGVRG